MKKYSTLTQSILSYLTERGTDYAIMISGEWGSGKSYFVRNELRPAVEAELRGARLLHVSLNGIQQLDEIYQKILVELIGESGSKARIGFGLLKVMLDLEVEVPYIKLNTKKIANVLKNTSLVIAKESSASPDLVLCFDDLERIAGDLNQKAVLGYIHSNFIETKSMKVILVCDENKIGSDDFSKIKEKIVGRTYVFRPDLNEIFSSLAAGVADTEAFRTAIAGERESLLEFCEKHKIQNLRTIRFVLSVLNSLMRASGELPQDIFHRIAYTVAAISIEYKAGRLATIRSISAEDFLVMMLSAATGLRENEGSRTESISYEEEFYGKYVRSNWNDYIWLDSIYELITEGYLDSEKFLRQLSPYIDLDASPQESTIDKLAAFRELGDEEFKEVVHATFHFVEAGVLTIKQFLWAASLLVKFWGNGLLEKDPSDLLQIGKAKILGKITVDEFPGMLRDEFESFYKAESLPILREILEEVLAAYEELSRKRMEGWVRDFYSKLLAGHSVNSKDYNRISGQAIMCVLPIAEMQQMLEGASNRGLTRFRELLLDRYLRGAGIPTHYSSERPIFLLLEEHLRQQRAAELRKFVLDEVADLLRKVAEHLGEEADAERKEES